MRKRKLFGRTLSEIVFISEKYADYSAFPFVYYSGDGFSQF